MSQPIDQTSANAVRAPAGVEAQNAAVQEATKQLEEARKLVEQAEKSLEAEKRKAKALSEGLMRAGMREVPRCRKKYATDATERLSQSLQHIDMSGLPGHTEKLAKLAKSLMVMAAVLGTPITLSLSIYTCLKDVYNLLQAFTKSSQYGLFVLASGHRLQITELDPSSVKHEPIIDDDSEDWYHLHNKAEEVVTRIVKEHKRVFGSYPDLPDAEKELPEDIRIYYNEEGL